MYIYITVARDTYYHFIMQKLLILLLLLLLAGSAHVLADTTLVTGFYDIQRTGRGFDEYRGWVRKTLTIPLPFVVFCSPENEALVWEARGEYGNITLVIAADTFPLQGLSSIIQPILSRIGEGRGSVEWNNPKYIPVIFSKFAWLNTAIQQNPFGTSHFHWVDAGISRFFRIDHPKQRAMEVFSILPAEGVAITVSPKFTKQHVQSITTADVVIGSQNNYVQAGIFGGSKASVQLLSYAMLALLTQHMLGAGVADNEQIGMDWLYVRHRDMFYILDVSDFTPGCVVFCL